MTNRIIACGQLQANPPRCTTQIAAQPVQKADRRSVYLYVSYKIVNVNITEAVRSWRTVCKIDSR